MALRIAFRSWEDLVWEAFDWMNLIFFQTSLGLDNMIGNLLSRRERSEYVNKVNLLPVFAQLFLKKLGC